MTCRETAMGSATTSLATATSGIRERQVLSTFHALQRGVRGHAPAPTPEQINALVDRQIEHVQSANLRQGRRRSLLNRLERSRSQPLDGHTYYAATHVLDRSREGARALTDLFGRMARVEGVTVGDIRTQVDRNIDRALADASLRPPQDWRPGYAEWLRQNHHVPIDRATAWALWQQELHGSDLLASAATRNTVTRQRVENSSVIREMGYDPTTGRLELTMHSNPDRVYTYRLTQDQYNEFTSAPSLGSYYSRHIRGERAYQYRNTGNAERNGVTTQCVTCGQFADANHTCPVRGSVEETAATTRQARQAARARRGDNTPVPPDMSVPQGQRIEPARWVVSGYGLNSYYATADNFREMDGTVGNTHIVFHSPGQIRTYGGVNVEALPDGGFAVYPVTQGSRALRCWCNAAPDCVHTQAAVDWYRDILNNRSDRGAQHAAAEAVVAADHDESAVAQTAAIEAETARGPVVSYVDDMDAFQAVYNAAKERRAAGEPAIRYVTDGTATGGLGAPGTGRRFGTEIEFGFPDDMTGGQQRAALAAIGRELYAAGLTNSAYQRDYGATHGVYRENHHGGWSFEQDDTVAGEITSPAMADTEETWRNVALVCDIVKRHGGIAVREAGSHIHVSTGDYDHDVDNHNRLLAAYHDSEDVLFRLAANPDRGTHRGLLWCQPNRVAGNYATVQDAAINNSHGRAVNLYGTARGDAQGHVEYRLWDASLDPAVIQAQIVASLGMTQHAFTNRSIDPTRPQPLGGHRRHNRDTFGATRRLTGEDWRNDTLSFRELVDKVCPSEAQKEMLTSLFAITKWQRR